SESELRAGLQRVEVTAEALDLVAQLRRVLEAQLLGGRQHLLLELDQRARDLLGRHALLLRLALAPAALWNLRLGSGQELADVGDPLADRLRRDPVLLVVGDLDRPAPIGLAERRAHRRRLA